MCCKDSEFQSFRPKIPTLFLRLVHESRRYLRRPPSLPMNNRDLRNRHAFEEKKPSSGNLSSNNESSGRSIDRGKNPEGSRRCPEDACVIVGGPRQCKILSTHTNDKEKKNKKKRYRSTISQLQLQLTTGVPLQRVKQKRYPAEQCSLEAFLSLYLVFFANCVSAFLPHFRFLSNYRLPQATYVAKRRRNVAKGEISLL